MYQHIVPKAHLERFTGSDGMLQVHRFKDGIIGRPYQKSPSKVSGEFNYYDDNPWLEHSMEKGLKIIEDKGQRAIDRILDHTATNGRTCIALKGKSRPSLPASATIPGNGKSGKYLYLLNALGWEPVKESPVGTVRMEYVDGTAKEFPVVSGIDTGNFWNPRTLPNGIPVWRGSNDCATIGVYASKFSLSG